MDTKNIYRAQARKELTEHIVYAALARKEKNPGNRASLEKLSAQEKTHYEFWSELLGEKPTPHSFTVFWIPFLRSVLGVTFVTRLLESHEKNSIATYEAMLPSVPDSHMERLRAIIEDERSHERALVAELKEKRISYIGFIALGLADAIVEITGVHAGFLGVTGSTLIAGISGIIVGFSAAISMGSAAYIQAKQEPGKSTIVSALTTGFSYFFSVILLALPYFLIRAMIPAFVVSVSVGIALLAAFTYYGAVVFEKKFLRDFGESAGLMLFTAVATYVLGTVVGSAFHLGAGSF